MFGMGYDLLVRCAEAACGGRCRECWRRGVAEAEALGFLEGLDAVDDVHVDGGAEGVFDGGANEHDSSRIDGAVRSDELVHEADGLGRALLKHQGGMREGFLAVVAKFVLEVVVLAEPAAQGALADVGLARGGGDRACGEQGPEGAFLAGSESVVEDIGVRSAHMFTLAGDWGKARGDFVKSMILKGIKI